MTYSTPESFKQPILQWDDNAEDWTLIEDYIFEWGDPHEGVLKRITIPAGKDYDKASVPKLVWGVFRPDGPWEAPALIHDMGYQYKGDFNAGGLKYETCIDQEKGTWKPGGKWNRKQVDKLFAFMGKCAGAKYVGVYYSAVRAYPPNWFKGF